MEVETTGSEIRQTAVERGSVESGDSGVLSRVERIQRNLEQVLNLEQSSSEQLEGVPLPRQAPMARRPGDGNRRTPGNTDVESCRMDRRVRVREYPAHSDRVGKQTG